MRRVCWGGEAWWEEAIGRGGGLWGGASMEGGR